MTSVYSTINPILCKKIKCNNHTHVFSSKFLKNISYYRSEPMNIFANVSLHQCNSMSMCACAV